MKAIPPGETGVKTFDGTAQSDASKPISLLAQPNVGTATTMFFHPALKSDARY